MVAWLSICGFLTLPLLAQNGDIAGAVRVTRNLTKKKITLPQIYERSVALAAPPAAQGDLGEELSRVVLYLEGLRGAEPLRASIDQNHRRFEPEVLAVPVGSTVDFPNSDPLYHNVFSLSKTKRFDLGNYPRGTSRSITFDQAGVVLVNCHLHPNMSAVIVVTPNRHYARPDAKGAFKLPSVPPGKYQLVAWHKSAGRIVRRVTVEPGRTSIADFEIPLTEIASR